VLARRQFETCLGLARTEIKVVPVLRDRCIEIERFVHVNEQMMMPAVREIVAGVGDAHVP